MAGHVQKKGKNWYCVIEMGMRDGKRLPPKWISVRKELGLNKPATKRQAQELLYNLLSQQQQGTFIRPADMTLKEFFDKWLPIHSQNIKPKTIQVYKDAFRVHINEVLGNKKLAELNARMIQDFLNAKTMAGMAHNSARRLHSNLHAMLEVARKWEYIPRNPMENLPRPQITRAEDNYWDAEDMKTFLRFIKDDNYYPLFYFALSTGLRKKELITLKWSQIDGNQVKIIDSKTQSGIRSIYVSDKMLSLLDRVDAEYVFTNKQGRPNNHAHINRVFNDLVRKAGIKKITIHGLRHTYITYLLDQGVDSAVIAKRVGHSDVNVLLKTYTHKLPQKEKEVAEITDNLL